MGDRANVVIYEGPKNVVFLYTHWTGSTLPKVLKAALQRGRERWSDAPYLARIVFCEMVRGEELTTTGYGIATTPCDNEYPLLVVDVARGVVVEYPEAVYNAHKFRKLAGYPGKPLRTYTGKWSP